MSSCCDEHSKLLSFSAGLTIPRCLLSSHPPPERNRVLLAVYFSTSHFLEENIVILELGSGSFRFPSLLQVGKGDSLRRNDVRSANGESSLILCLKCLLLAVTGVKRVSKWENCVLAKVN